ncbi:hypothetical protein [Streptomyces sp. ODS05-4]|uniref:hypothetical protein n=1 Tax=Streptomyces sp. ODS05-4 TaxID=2944939 RepID=UPI00210B9811|nr:hypothetical protein [Streptomyces sp. ODS05-4]
MSVTVHTAERAHEPIYATLVAELGDVPGDVRRLAEQTRHRASAVLAFSRAATAADGGREEPAPDAARVPDGARGPVVTDS